MAAVLEITEDRNAGLYDSATGKSCVTEKVVDVTDECPLVIGRERSIFLFTRAERGRIVQMTLTYDRESYTGTHIHFFVDELAAEMSVTSPNDTFGRWADMLGITKAELLALIEEHAPPA